MGTVRKATERDLRRIARTASLAFADDPVMRWLIPDDIEYELQIPKPTQASMRSRRQIPFVLIGPRTPRYRRAEIAAWLAERAIPAGVRGGGR